MKKALRIILIVFTALASCLPSIAQTGTITRGPYLQMGSQTAITIRWRTAAPEDSKIELGTVYGSYPLVVTEVASVTEHIVRVSGLAADTKYYYKVGNTTAMGAADAAQFFTTAPPSTTTRKIRVAAFGDCGRASSTYQDENLTNYQSFLSANGFDAPDAWILLGDNAYIYGTDAEYSTNFFGIYGSSILKNHKLYPAPGNHDYANDNTQRALRTAPYYNNFSLPQAAECGGVASGKPNFYSFDIGNIHFLSLDAWGIESDGTHMGTAGSTTLKTWINSDLAANTKKWTVAYWHHSPYTKSSHNSDIETELGDIRTNFIGYLESRGVDLIVCGHSHAYERSYLLKNYTSSWGAFNASTHTVSTSSATYTSNTSCPYIYNSTPAHHGTVYVVAGSTGASGGTVAGQFGTGPMPYAVNDAGVLYFEVEDNRLDAKLLRRNGTVFDQFTIMKDVNKTSTFNISQGQSINLTASWPGAGSYAWNTAQSGRSINVTPPLGSTVYTVTDQYGCLSDQFTVNANAALPVTFAGYDVVLQKGLVNIRWTTKTESGSKVFTVERSVDGVDFRSLLTVPGAGTSTSERKYLLTDKQPLKGASYYRLSQQDQNGNTRYFDVKKIVNAEGRSFNAQLVAQSTAATVRITSTGKQIITMTAYDLSGRTIKKETWQVAAGFNDKQVNMASGNYIVHFANEKGEKAVQRIIIQ